MNRVACLVVALSACRLQVGEHRAMGSGSVALSVDEALVYVVDTDNEILSVHDERTLETVATVKVGASPRRVVVSVNDDVFVANRMSRSVSHIRRGEWKVAREIAVCADPVDIETSPEGETLYVLCATSSEHDGFGSLLALDVTTFATRWSLEIPEEPRELAVLALGKAVVSHLRTADVDIVELHSGGFLRPPQTARSYAGGGVLASGPRRAEAYLFTNRTDGASPLDPTRLELRRVDAIHKPTDLIAFSPNAMGISVSAAVVSSGNGLWLSENIYAVSSETGELLTSPTTAAVGEGVDGIASTGWSAVLFTYSQFEHRLSRAFFDAEGAEVERSVVVAADVLPPDVVRGRLLFHSRGAGGERSCASCHLEGRDDGRAWAFSAALRQTPALAGRAMSETPPLGWAGEQAGLGQMIDHMIRWTGGAPLDAASSTALAAYVSWLPPPAVARRDATSVGAAAFEKAGCAACHPASSYTNRRSEDVGHGAFDVPSLLGVARSGPYLHDGSAADLEAVLAETTHGTASGLSADERRELLQFLLTL